MSDRANAGGGRAYRRRRGGRRRGWLALAIGAVALVVAAVALLGLSSASGAEEVPRGVEVGGIPLGGMSVEEAESTLQERAYGLNEVRVSGDGEEAVIPADSLGVEPDVEATVQNAREVGHEGDVVERISDRADGVFGTVEVPLEVSYNDEMVRSQAEGLAARLDEESRPAAVEVGADDAAVSSSAEGYEVDVEQTAGNIRESIESLEGEAELVGGVVEPEITTPEAEDAAEVVRTAIAEPAVLEAEGQQWSLGPAQISAAVDVSPRDGELRVSLDRRSLRGSLDEMYSTVNTPSREADYQFVGDGVEVVPGEIGRRIESQKLLDELESGLPEGQRDYDVAVDDDEPELTTEEAEAQRPTQLIGEYRTTFEGTGDDDPDRVDNLETASEGLTGQTVAPGEVFSANDVLAPLDYKETSVFVDGKEEKAAGGGLCQVSSTLYMAANYAGMQPVERHPHFALLNYIRPGLDATVWFGAENGYSGQELDMKFRNTSDGHIMIREYVDDDGYIYAEVWGQPTGREVTMTSRDQGTNSESSSWATYKTVENANGATIFDGEYHSDTYYALETDDGELPPDEIDPAPVNP